MFTGEWRSSQKSKWRVEARATSVESHISSVSRSVVEEADRAARVTKKDLPIRILIWRVGDIPELTAARGGSWLGFG